MKKKLVSTPPFLGAGQLKAIYLCSFSQKSLLVDMFGKQTTTLKSYLDDNFNSGIGNKNILVFIYHLV
jgi:hypothetical protein